MGAASVVEGDPLIERRLGHREVAKHLAGVELDAQGAMKALDLAGRGWRARLGQEVLDAVKAADPIEEHLDRGMGVLASEDLAVVGQDLFGSAVRLQRCGE